MLFVRLGYVIRATSVHVMTGRFHMHTAGALDGVKGCGVHQGSAWGALSIHFQEQVLLHHKLDDVRFGDTCVDDGGQLIADARSTKFCDVIGCMRQKSPGLFYTNHFVSE